MNKLPYGDKYLVYRLPEVRNIDILKAAPLKVDGSEKQIVKGALARPLKKDFPSKIGPDTEISIAISDLTRPVPNQVILPPLLKKLTKQGASSKNITIIAGTGKHRLHKKKDLIKLVGKHIYNKYRVVSHNAENKRTHCYLGQTTGGTPLYIDKDFVEADIKIITGMIDPHQIVGFTGGLKAVTIGLGYKDTIENNHKLMFDEGAGLGNYLNNPVRNDIDEVGKYLDIDFALNIILNDNNQIIKALAGDEKKVWQRGVEFLNNTIRAELPRAADIVIASAGGYPKDINLYQAQKALYHATGIVKKGGIIILVAECREGIGSPGFKEVMGSCSRPEGVIKRVKNNKFRLGAHKGYLFSYTLKKADVYLVSDKIKPGLASTFKIRIFTNLQGAINKALSNQTEVDRVAVLSKASSLIPSVKEEVN